MKDPQAIDSVHISIIRFADRADQDPLIAIDQFTPPALIADGLTAMGAAINLLVDSIEQDLVPNDPVRNVRGDFRPIVFLLTDGEPTDDFRTPTQRLKALRSNQKPTIVALGCGPYVNSTMLHEIADSNVFIMHQTSPDTIKSFFKWLSSSVTTASHTAAGGGTATMTSPAFIPGIAYDPS